MADVINPLNPQAEKKVLLVEDDLFLSNLLASRLKRLAINVVKVYEGDEVLKAMQTHRPDLVLLDIIIPKKSGFEILEEMKGEPVLKDIPVIILSNLGQEADIARAREYGVKQYYIKAQHSIDEIANGVKAFLDTGATPQI